MLSRKEYIKILGSVPVLTVDLLVKYRGKYLLVKRNNKPLKGQYYIPGGRVFRDETIKDAVKPNLWEEVRLKSNKVKFVGYIDGRFKDNEFNLDYIRTVSLLFLCEDLEGDIKLDSQGADYKWSNKIPNKPKIYYA